MSADQAAAKIIENCDRRRTRRDFRLRQGPIQRVKERSPCPLFTNDHDDNTPQTMFNNSSVTSAWGQPAQNQQQQPATNAFGQPATTPAFGATNGKPLPINSFRAPCEQSHTAFSGGAFGQPQPQPQPQQQQQQPANPMFGGLGGTSGTPASGNTGFGAWRVPFQVLNAESSLSLGGFGTPANNATGNSIFGAPKPTTGFGAFGGGGTSFGAAGNAFGGTTGAGTAGTGTGIFGPQPNNTTSSAFGGTTGGMFGAKPATTTAFGTVASEYTRLAIVPL